MTVPKAPVHEYDRPVFRQHDVGTTGQVLSVEAKSIPEPMCRSSHHDLGRRVPASHRGHIARTLLPGQTIGHSASAAQTDRGKALLSSKVMLKAAND